MRILVGQNHMNTIGGTETFTYTLVHELVKQGHDVGLYTIVEGSVSNRLKKELPGIEVNKFNSSYDVALVNHNTTVKHIRDKGYCDNIIQTCHGTLPELEQPSPYASSHVSISKEIKDYLKSLNFESNIILNGIDCNRFKPVNPIRKKIRHILSLSQSRKANSILEEACNIIGCDLITFNKHTNPTFYIEDYINECDVVVGLGRSAYDSMACGRPVFIWDCRAYQGNLGDGFIKPYNELGVINYNCSGRYYKNEYNAKEIAKEILENYDYKESGYYRELALDKFNIEKQVEKYLLST